MVKNTLKELLLLEITSNKDKKYSISELSKTLNKDYKNVYEALKELDSINVVKKNNYTEVSFKPFLTPENYKAEFYRREGFKDVSLKKIVEETNPYIIIILFGSRSKNKEGKNSDVDICLIHDDEEVLERTVSEITIHPLVEIQYFTTKEFISLLRTKKFNISHEILKTGIILKNVESYYQLIKEYF